MIHEFVCGDCEIEVFSYSGAPDTKVCQSCLTIREMKARDPMTPEAEAALREILGCVISVHKGAGTGTIVLDIAPEEP